MNFDAFNKTELEQYAAEVKEKWGSTKAYKEYELKTEGKTDKEIKKTIGQLMTLFSEIGSLKQLLPSEKAVQDKIRSLQEFITENYYTCTDEILKGFGQMYVCDERMKQNIDKAGGKGTAEFVRQAVFVYCAQKH